MHQVCIQQPITQPCVTEQNNIEILIIIYAILCTISLDTSEYI